MEENLKQDAPQEPMQGQCFEIKNVNGKVIFSHTCVGNTFKTTIEKVKDLRGASLRGVNLSDVNLRGADLRSADLGSATLSGADLRNADLRGAYLGSADLRGAYLGSADLRGADLRDATLSYANLSGANLRDADLRGVNLKGAITDKKYYQASCIGSRKDTITYCVDDDVVWCGCFKGSLNEFKEAVANTHANSPTHLKEYEGFINYILSL